MSVGVRKGGEAHKAPTGGQRLMEGVYLCVTESPEGSLFVTCACLHLPGVANWEWQLFVLNS